MTQTIEDLHVYLRSIRPEERTSLSTLAEMIPAGSKVLDLGCGSGALGQYLAETRSCVSDGVTWSEAEAAHARPHYRHVHVADLETADLPTLFAGERYDAIVCADVLEHLRHPESVLAAARNMLSAEGRLLISVPNASYSGLIAELLKGEFKYRKEGLLDETHLRFFTRRSLVRFMTEQRWAIDTLEVIERPIPESEFKVEFDDLPPSVARFILSGPDALSYQFVGAARPVESAEEAVVVQESFPAEGKAHFSAELYLGRDGQYREADKLTASGIIGQDRQTVRFDIPAADVPCTHLRLDPADRPGYLHLYGIALKDAQGAELWKWDAQASQRSLLATTPHHEIVWQAPLPAASGATLLLMSGEDPWFEVPVPVEILRSRSPGGLALEVELGWPMSTDYLALAATVHPLHDRIAQLEGDLLDTQGHLHQVQSSLSADLATARSRNALLEESNRATGHQRATWQREATRVQRDYDDLARHLKNIEASTVFRATRPLVHAKMRIDRLLGRAPKSSAAATSTAQPMPAPAHPVDIIVPVYRGLADTQLCIESVLASSCTSAYRLIVINDASPEPEVTAWLREKAAQDNRVTLLENPENLGFVGTVNRGMALSDSHDVLLLNSDTEVANDWLDRIRRAAYSDQKVASVTPFSNNATICSYPRFCEGNDLPEGYSTARLDALCAATNPGAVVDVPTGVGFCMYVRRDSLADVGLFDTENFGKGYGEENDFCQRAAAKGWRNLHNLDTFVLHTGGVSFGDSKSPREKAAMETLRRLHPRYETEVMAFVQEDPAKPYRLALDVARIHAARLPVVLAVLHDRAGGTLRHVRELAAHLSTRAQFLVLTPAPGGTVKLQFAGAHEGFALQFSLEDEADELLQALTCLGVVHIHYHHLLGHDEKVLDLPHQLGVEYDFTAHDFFSYCTHISLTGLDGRYVGEMAPGKCKCCAPDATAPYGGTVNDWRHRNRHFLTAARNVIAPSHDTARRIAGLAPGANLLVVPHTDLDHAVPRPTPAPKALASNGTLKVVVLGALSAIKGADMLEAVAEEAARRNAPVEFHLLGYGYRSLKTQPKTHLTVHGAYEDKDLPRLLAWLQPDVAWFPAQWPETYSYTLSACLEAGLPVVAPDIGAFAERLADRPWSWVARWDQTPAQWLEMFMQVREENFVRQHLPASVPPLSLQFAALPSAQPESPAPVHYGNTYMSGFPARLESTQLPSLTHEFLAKHRANAAAGTAAKSLLLNGVLRLRSHPLLRGIAKRVPQHWQTRVKNWLQA
ncbi:methyltransferase domain-containing protein [Acidovorax sp. NPDC077693]|uniref:methyltransferase domain-containing protein n=1 Tax=unclassified Acidovorax TaxID=2684926 RepID=UPI0037CC6082